jgi:glycosyltransferase involved in cell wall biosynthesis
MKLASFVVPHSGGTYTVFRSLRAGLAAHGVDVRWLGTGTGGACMAPNQQWAAEHPEGCVVDVDRHDQAGASRVIEHLERENYDGVLAGALCGRFETNIVRYLPERFLRILIVHNITRGTYKAARVIRDHVHATIGVSPRVRNDLVRSYGFDGRHTHAVLNAVELARLRPIDRSARAGPLRLIFLGRLEDEAKGILWLPKILSRLEDLDIRLTVAVWSERVPRSPSA